MAERREQEEPERPDPGADPDPPTSEELDVEGPNESAPGPNAPTGEPGHGEEPDG